MTGAQAQAPRGLAAADIAAIWRVPVERVYRLAHRHRWRRYTDTGTVWYHPDDVAATMDNRAHSHAHRRRDGRDTPGT